MVELYLQKTNKVSETQAMMDREIPIHITHQPSLYLDLGKDNYSNQLPTCTVKFSSSPAQTIFRDWDFMYT